MNIEITQIRVVADGAELEVSLCMSAGEGKEQTVKGRIFTFLYRETELPTLLVEPYRLDRARCDFLIYLMQKTSAIKKGIVFLEYAKNTKKSLKTKLVRKGFSAEIAEEAAQFLEKKGYIREDDDAAQLAEALATRKLYGKSRIKKELFTKGFDAETIAFAMEEIEVDFVRICAKRISKAGGKALFSEPERKRKTTAALLRYGFSYAEIRDALDILDEPDENI